MFDIGFALSRFQFSEIKSKNLIIQCYSNKITYKGHKNGMPTIIKAAKEVGYIQE